MKPEDRSRLQIDKLLEEAGWKVQDYKDLNLGAALGLAVREVPLESGPTDYLLFVGKKAVGVIEAKPEGTTLSGVAEQSKGYIMGIPDHIPHVQEPLPFAYESTGTETFFRDLRDPDPRSRRVFAFHKPEVFDEWLSEKETLRARLRDTPELITEGLRPCQITAVQNLERSFSEAKPRALIQMASGSGKTFTTVNFVYRLIKFAGARKVLFLVDRNTLARQSRREFQQFVTPDDRRKFTELYNVQQLTSNTLDPVSKVCITTIQRLYSMLKGEEELDPELEEAPLFKSITGQEEQKEISYNPKIPIETFDFIVTDECHRSIYNLWRQVLEYFDAFVIGLTATPSKQTLGFFNQNLVTEYNHERAVADGVNVDYEVYRIRTEITEKGSKVETGHFIDKRDKITRKVRWELLDEELEYAPAQLDRSIVSPDQIRTVIRTFKERLFTEIFPGRKETPKTLIFAKDDSHAEDIVHIVREEFGKGNEFCKKITYKTIGEDTETLIASFRNSYNPRIIVSVDMISTGTDIRPLECLLFMRDVKSRVFFEQMKGRGSRTISSTDLIAVTPDSQHKTHYVIVDAVGVCESDKTDSSPLERKRSVPFDKLLMSLALGNKDMDTITSLAGRLARLEKELGENDKAEISNAAGKSIMELTNALLDAVDPDKKIEKAKEIFKTEKPTEEQVKDAEIKLTADACTPFDDPKIRNLIIDIKRRNEQIIDTISKDAVTFSGYDIQAKERASKAVGTFKKYIDDNKDELTALQIIYSKPFARRRITYEEIKRLAEAMEKPPYRLTPELLWKAYGQLEKAKVRGTGAQKLLTNIISLIRFAVGEYEILEPFTETVNKRFEEWLSKQEKSERKLTTEQKEWLVMIKDHITASLSIEMEDFELTPFHEKGGPVRADKLFGKDLNNILEELHEVLVKR